MSEKRVTVIGGGLAGTEAAWQLARRGIKVDLYEMRPVKMTGAHHTNNLSELVCSNSLGSYDGKNASALLKQEMRLLDSLIVESAWKCKVPAGGALAVDRESFAETITQAITGNPLITLHREEITSIPKNGVCIVATGPLTSPALAESISECTGEAQLHFFDAAAPILTRESVNMDIAYEKSRYDKGEGVYINCPMNKEEYLAFWTALTEGEKVELKDFEKDTPYFESCLPVEVIASRGVDTLRFGPLKPVGLEDPKTGKRAYAVVQLRQDNAAAKLYNIVGFQTNLKWPDQKRIFSMIPGLESAEFVRLGVMHRNTYLNSPVVLSKHLNLHKHPDIFFAGQLTGVEGYSESTATGIIAAINAARRINGEELLSLPGNCMIGALIRYITSADTKHFQPINSNWGIIDTPEELMKIRDKVARREEVRKIAVSTIEKISKELISVLIAFMLIVFSNLPASAEEIKAKVIAVQDGDSLTILHDQKKEKVILYGIDCPEMAQECGPQAKSFTEQICKNKQVSLTVHGKDRMGRTIAEVILDDGCNMSQELVEKGLAWWSDKYAPKDEELKRLQNTAKLAKIGVWTNPKPVPPWIFRNGQKSVQAVIKTDRKE